MLALLGTFCEPNSPKPDDRLVLALVVNYSCLGSIGDSARRGLCRRAFFGGRRHRPPDWTARHGDPRRSRRLPPSRLNLNKSPPMVVGGAPMHPPIASGRPHVPRLGAARVRPLTGARTAPLTIGTQTSEGKFEAYVRRFEAKSLIEPVCCDPGLVRRELNQLCATSAPFCDRCMVPTTSFSVETTTRRSCAGSASIAWKARS